MPRQPRPTFDMMYYERDDGLIMDDINPRKRSRRRKSLISSQQSRSIQQSRKHKQPKGSQM